jgi:hypothetical protein
MELSKKMIKAIDVFEECFVKELNAHYNVNYVESYTDENSFKRAIYKIKQNRIIKQKNIEEVLIELYDAWSFVKDATGFYLVHTDVVIHFVNNESKSPHAVSLDVEYYNERKMQKENAFRKKMNERVLAFGIVGSVTACILGYANLHTIVKIGIWFVVVNALFL